MSSENYIDMKTYQNDIRTYINIAINMQISTENKKKKVI